MLFGALWTQLGLQVAMTIFLVGLLLAVAATYRVMGRER